MEKAKGILTALGGKENIVEFEPCITRLRVDVVDPAAVNDKLLEEAGAFGVVKVGRSVQVVVGPTADTLAAEIQDLF